jgi:hypothetical protein
MFTLRRKSGCETYLAEHSSSSEPHREAIFGRDPHDVMMPCRMPCRDTNFARAVSHHPNAEASPGIFAF